MSGEDVGSAQDVFYKWNNKTLRLVKKDNNLGPYLWNAKQLVNHHTQEVLWDCTTDERHEFN
eukprot:CAMPEP_0181331632 /NCGR_PEP_ID=MMETSP1101-20121128/24616_1 /TAXON_ID=46948 /ORGANISM="Rhodomonas abbreviata, Strain Caron Lab Isolate" /LENGTH=61 /DNA_ID=CAMNT_0023441127 /DNA_START=185 /DNA_END=367 /DNA_ORIENTATION=-